MSREARYLIAVKRHTSYLRTHALRLNVRSVCSVFGKGTTSVVP